MLVFISYFSLGQAARMRYLVAPLFLIRLGCFIGSKKLFLFEKWSALLSNNKSKLEKPLIDLSFISKPPQNSEYYFRE